MMKTNNKKLWKNHAYDEVSVLDDDGEISPEDLKKIRKFIDEYSLDSKDIKIN